MNQPLELQEGGKSTYQFMVRNQTATLYIKTKNPSQVRFYISTANKKETLYYQSLYVNVETNEPMVNMSPQSLMRIEADEVIEDIAIEWSNN
jgi:DNA-dependent RNA polymerase auxiliary subunit epsilon